MTRDERWRDDVDVAVVGAGLAGLSAAALVARAGRSVRVLEKASHIGGRAATQEVGEVSFNLGPHALYAHGDAARLLRDLGVSVFGRVPSPGRAQVVLGNQRFRLPKGPVSLLGSRLLSIREKARLIEFLSRLKQYDARSLDHTPLADWVDREAGPGRLAQLVRALFRVSTYADDHERLSAGAALDQFRMALAGNVLYLDGGWQTIVAGLRDRAVADGTEIRTGSRVESVEATGEGTTIRLAGGVALRARATILALDPNGIRDVLGLPEDAPLVRWAEVRKPIRAASLDLALTSLPRPGDRFALGLDRPLYYSVHSAAARLAPEGIAVVHVMKYLGGAPASPAEDIERELERFLDVLQPGWRHHVQDRRFLPGLTVTHALPEAATGGLVGRPAVEVPGRPGVFLAGDWVGSEGMLADASAASAAMAARLALDHLAANQPGRAESLSHAER